MWKSKNQVYGLIILILFVQSVFSKDMVRLLFQENFEYGISREVWKRESIWGRKWIGAIMTGAEWNPSPDHGRCIVSVPVRNEKGMGSDENHFLDITSRKNDFKDFIFTWDMRFDTKGSHRDHRLVYFRSSPSEYTEPVGYEIHFAVWVPFLEPGYYVRIRRRNKDGSLTFLKGTKDVFWDLHRWYTFKIEVIGNQFRLKIWEKGKEEPKTWLLTATDPKNTYHQGGIGFGNYWAAITYLDNIIVLSIPKK